jgi:hypothetical protein
MSVDKQLEKMISDIPKAVAAGVVDLGIGMLLGIKTTGSHPKEVFDFLAAATQDLFEGDNVNTIENIFKKARGIANDDHYFQEFLIMSSNLLHYFGRTKESSIVVGVVTQADANIGLVLSKARMAAKALEI